MVTLAGPLFSGASDHFEWRPPGKPITVSIAFDVIEGILSRSERWRPWRKRSETGGILLGQVESGEFPRVRIDGAADVPCGHVFGRTYSLGAADKKAIRAAIEDCRTSEQRVVGVYRIHSRAGLSLDADDVLLLSEIFPGAENVALLIKPRTIRDAIGGFFFWEGSGIHSESSYLEFLVNRRKRRIAVSEPEPTAGKPAAGEAQVAEAVPVAAVPALPARSSPGVKRPAWCSLWVQAPLFALLLAAQGYLGFISGRELTRISKPRQVPHDPYTLSLRVLEYGDNLQLTWDRVALPVASAERALVSITDGQNTRDLELTPAQLRSGSVIYRRVSPDVRFRLEVFMSGNRSVSETWDVAAAEGRSSGTQSQPRPGNR